MNALSNLTSKVCFCCSELGRTKLRLNKQIEDAWLRPCQFLRFFCVFCFMVSDRFRLISSNALMADTTFNQRVSEKFCVTRCLPNFFWHKYCSTHWENIFPVCDECFPKVLLDVVAQLYTKWAVIVYTRETAIYFRTLKHKTASLCERNDFFHEIALIYFFFSHC